MIELIIKEYLSRKISVPIFLEHQENEPTKFIIFEKVGGSQKLGLKQTSVAFQAYGQSLYESAVLARELTDIIEGLVEDTDIVSIAINSGYYHFPDLERKKHRHQLVVDIKHY